MLKGFRWFVFLTLIVATEIHTRQDMYQVAHNHWCLWCPAGTYLLKNCELNEGPSVCKPCPENQFIDKPHNKTECRYCTVCEDRTLIKACTKTSDSDCRCPQGKYWHVYPGPTGLCVTHRNCPRGTLKAGTPWDDAVCVESSTQPNSTPQSQTTPRPEETTNRGVPTLSTTTGQTVSSSTTPHCPPVACESSQTCCYVLIPLVVVQVVVIVVLVAAFIYRERKHQKATVPATATELEPMRNGLN